jgi:plasmid stabilization system protein ParE
MVFRVELSDRAQADITAIYDWLRSHQAGDAGERWFVALREAITSLSTLPLRCSVAAESREAPVEVRQLLYGRQPHVYRILFGRRRCRADPPYPAWQAPTGDPVHQ